MSKAACTLYLVRHGETEWNQKGRVQGHTDIALSLAGELQAKERGDYFKDTVFHAAFSSDLCRAERTAEILIQDRELQLNRSSALREQSWGMWEGHSFDELRHQFGKEFNAYTGTLEHPVPTVESHLATANRVVPFLLETAVSFPDKTLLVVTHGGVLKSLVYYLGLEEYAKYSFSNLAFMKVRVEMGGEGAGSSGRLVCESIEGVYERQYGEVYKSVK